MTDANAKTVINAWSGRTPIVMSLAAIAVLALALSTGWSKGPDHDEGAAARLWQLLIAGQAPLIVAFLATANWRRPLGIALVFGLQVLGLMLAMAPVLILRL